MSDKLWGGRFQTETNALVDQFGASINFDQFDGSGRPRRFISAR